MKKEGNAAKKDSLVRILFWVIRDQVLSFLCCYCIALVGVQKKRPRHHPRGITVVHVIPSIGSVTIHDKFNGDPYFVVADSYTAYHLMPSQPYFATVKIGSTIRDISISRIPFPPTNYILAVIILAACAAVIAAISGLVRHFYWHVYSGKIGHLL